MHIYILIIMRIFYTLAADGFVTDLCTVYCYCELFIH